MLPPKKHLKLIFQSFVAVFEEEWDGVLGFVERRDRLRMQFGVLRVVLELQWGGVEYVVYEDDATRVHKVSFDDYFGLALV
jgi:hypothetical protein